MGSGLADEGEVDLNTFLPEDVPGEWTLPQALLAAPTPERRTSSPPSPSERGKVQPNLLTGAKVNRLLDW